MTTNRKDDRDALQRLAAAIVEDVLSESDDKLIAEMQEEGLDPASEADAMRALIDRAAVQCGKARLKSAKEAVAATKSMRRSHIVVTDVAEARRKLAAILAKNANSGLSLAARKETEMSDSDVLGMLEDFEELGFIPGSDDSSDRKN